MILQDNYYSDTFPTVLQFVVNSELKPGFHLSGKSITICNFTVSRLSQILLTKENSKSWVFLIDWAGRGLI